jgi:hypothetical protein
MHFNYHLEFSDSLISEFLSEEQQDKREQHIRCLEPEFIHSPTASCLPGKRRQSSILSFPGAQGPALLPSPSPCSMTAATFHPQQGPQLDCWEI